LNFTFSIFDKLQEIFLYIKPLRIGKQSIFIIIVIFIKQELLLPIAGFIFIMEALSVMIQVWHFKTFGKRVFKMAPIHHHFELLGLPETKVTIRFWIVSIMTCLLTFVILKLR